MWRGSRKSRHRDLLGENGGNGFKIQQITRIWCETESKFPDKSKIVMSGTVSGVLEEALRLKELLCRGGFIDPASTQFQIHSCPQKSRPVRKE